MEIAQELSGVTPQGKTLLAIGVFDGVHAGHRHLLTQLQQRAAEANLISGVVTFSPHPQTVLHPARELPWLSDLDDRVTVIQQLGVDIVAVLTFTPELAQLSAGDFMSLLKKYLKMQGIMVGPDFVLGRGGEADISLLRTLGDEMGFIVHVIPPFTIEGEVVSSTLIRQALARGDMGRVEKLMGRRFYLKGKVITSDKRGQLLGFPTANLDMKPEQALPDDGIYATITQVNDNDFPSATNIGTRPTFGKGERMVETYLLNYKGNLYGKQIVVQFVRKVRDEQHFSSVDELIVQMKRDVQEVDAILAGDVR